MRHQRTNIEHVGWRIADLAREMHVSSPFDTGLAICVSAAIRNTGNVSAASSPEELRSFMKSHFDGNVRDYLLSTKDSFLALIPSILGFGIDDEMLSNLALHFEPQDSNRFDWSSPISIRQLAIALLNPTKEDSVADLCCADGGFLIDVAKEASPSRMYGSERSQGAATLAQARLAMVGYPNSVQHGDCFEEPNLATFDKVYVNCPVGMRMTDLRRNVEYTEPLLTGKGPMGHPANASWAFAKLAFDSLTADGTAVVVMANGGTFNLGDISARRYFVENGMVKSIVALPEGLFAATRIACTMLVLGRNDGEIRMVDATDLASKGRRQNTLDAGAIDEILTRLSEDSESSALVTRDEIAARDYTLYPPRYLEQLPELENPMPLGDVATSIERGSNLTARQLDELTTQEDTGMRYVRIQDVSDGTISNGCPAITSIDAKDRGRIIHNGDLVISKTGHPSKIAVADIPEGQDYLACGNLYVVRLNTELVDPYFLAAFLESEDGQQMLEASSAGVRIPTLRVSDLRQMVVPVPPMEKQRKIAQAYRANLDETQVLRIKVNKALARRTSIYDEVMGR